MNDLFKTFVTIKMESVEVKMMSIDKLEGVAYHRPR